MEDDDPLTSNFNDYKADVCNYLELVDVFKDLNETAKSKIVNHIEEASQGAIALIKHLKNELIKDAVSHLNEQVREYETYEKSVSSSFNDVKESLARGRGRDAIVTLNKAIYALEKPVQKVFSFMDQWDDISKSDIGIIVCDNVSHDKLSSSVKRVPFKKRNLAEKHSPARLPKQGVNRSLLGGSRSSTTESCNKSTARLLDFDDVTNSPSPGKSPVKRDDCSTAEVKLNTNDLELVSSAVSAEPVEREDHSTAVMNLNTDDFELVSSAVNEWTLLESAQAPPQPYTCIGAGGDAANGWVENVPSINISFSSLALSDSPAKPVIKNELVLDSTNVVTLDNKNGLAQGGSPSVISRYLNSGAAGGVIHAKLVTTLGDLNYPIGVCVYAGGLVVCNSGDSSVIHLKYNSNGKILKRTVIPGKFRRPSAAVVDKTNTLFIKDDRAIHRYSEEFQWLNSISCSTKPFGLALMDDNCLVTMCDCGDGRNGKPKNPRLLKYDIYGNLLSTIRLKLPLTLATKLRFMDVSGNVIYISDLGASFVYMADLSTGALIEVLAGPGKQDGHFSEPSGVTCDKDGNILIADSKSNRIQIFDGKEGQFQGILRCQGGLTRPSGILLGDDSELYAVNYLAHSVNIYQLD